VLGFATRTPFEPHRIPLYEFAINGERENAVQDCYVEGQAPASSRKLLRAYFLETPNLELLHEGPVHSLQFANSSFLQKCGESTDCLLVPVSGRFREFAKRNSLPHLCGERCF
jgi:hypothetical protein